MSSSLAGQAVLALWLAMAPGLVPLDEPTGFADAAGCQPVGSLHPSASGAFELVSSQDGEHGERLHWVAAAGDTLRLELRVERLATYALTVRLVGSDDATTLAALLWDAPLSSSGKPQATPRSASGAALADAGLAEVASLRFDPLPLEPGRHVLELRAVEAGDFLLDCIALLPTGPWVSPRAPAGDRPFLGVVLESSSGVAIGELVPGGAAELAGLAAGDELLCVDGARVTDRNDISAAIARHAPGETLALHVRRGTTRFDVHVVLGRRAGGSPPSDKARRVIEVVDVRPGQTLADLGSGSGWLAEALAAAAGPQGLVYAVEIKERSIRQLRDTATTTVLPVHSFPDDICLPEECLDTAVLHDVASHIAAEARPGFYRSVARALRPTGKLVVFGPHGKAQQMLDVLAENGFHPVDAAELAELSPDDLDARLRDGIAFSD